MSETIMKCIKDMDGVYCYIKTGVVVRCRDCIHFSELIPGTIPVCLRYGDFKEDDYCSHGELRDA